MVTDISWWALDGCCYFLVGSGWLLLFPGGLWMVAVISWWAVADHLSIAQPARCTPTSTAVRTYREHSVNRHRVSSLCYLPSQVQVQAQCRQGGINTTFR